MPTKKYIAKILVVVEADSVAEACDAMSGAMSETLHTSGMITDWAYPYDPDLGEVGLPQRVAEKHNSDRQEYWDGVDLNPIYAHSKYEPL